MTFVVVLCEGYSEMDFVAGALNRHLAEFGIGCQPELFGKKVMRDVATSPGGVLSYAPVYKHICATIRRYSSDTSFITTMMDFYAFPTDFPDYSALRTEPDPATRVANFESKLYNEVGREPRFIPYIQLHEFEALIFADLESLLAQFPGIADIKSRIARLEASVQGLSPEQINQTRTGAPSKRLMDHLPYRKREMGTRLVNAIGIPRLKAACPHFGAWITRLEQLGIGAQ